MGNLHKKKCIACSGDTPALSETEIITFNKQINNWNSIKNQDGIFMLSKYFKFKNYIKCNEKKSKNWDLERIALMDQILIKMAFCEILNMEDLPVKVTLNEYIEISKYYSTNKSKMFVNGLLDNAVNDLSLIHI